jgi:hypothetical protein
MDAKEIEQTLGDLDDKIARLRALYEQYFMGIEKLEPQTPRKEVDRIIAQMRKIQLRNTAQRFRFQTIIQRYNTMQQHWGRTLREMEAGTFRRDVLRAAERFGVDEAVTALGKRRAAKMAAALEAKKKQEVEREKIRRKLDGSVHQEEELEEAELVEDDDDDDAPTPPPQRPRPSAPQVWELHDPSDELTYVPPGAEPVPRAPTAAARSASLNPFAGLARSPSIQSMPQAAVEPANALETTASYPSAVELRLQEGTEKKPSGGLRLGGGPRRASAEALHRIASALVGEGATAPAPAVLTGVPSSAEARFSAPPAVTAVPPAPYGHPGAAAEPRPSGAGLVGGFRPPGARVAASATAQPPSPLPPADPLASRKPLLSQPLDIDLTGLGPAPAPSSPAAPPRESRKPHLSQPLDIDLEHLGPAPAPARPSTGAALRPSPEPSVPSPSPRAPPVPAATPSSPADAGSTGPAAPSPPREPVPARPPSAARPVARPPASPSAEAKDLNDQRMREIYAQYVQKRREHNEPTTNITFEKLSESLRSQTEKLKQKHASKKIDYEVVVKDGKTLIKPIVR